MQNIPGLSFFDGLTRSRALQSRTSSNSASSPPETPLQDATPFRNGKGADIDTDTDTVSHPLGKDGDRVQDESSDTFDDPLSLATSNSNSSASTLPAASFSRRAATISSGSSSPMPGLPGRRATSSSTMGRSSILSLDNIFSAPILSRRASSITESATASGRARSASTASKENEEPTAKDVSLMAQGTQAYAMLKRIQEHPIELADIIRLLVTKKAILILPTCPISKDESGPTRATYEDHVIIPESTQGESLFVTLSGIRGVLKPASSSVAILGMATGQDFGTIASDASGLTKRSFFDNVSKSEGPEGSGAVDGSKELKLVNSSKRPVVIFVDSVGSIHTLLVDSVIPSPEGDAVPTPIVPLAIGIATVKDRSAAMRTPSAASSVRSMNISDDKDGTPLPKLPRIASDLPLEWDSTVKDLESFVAKLRKSPLPNGDRYANDFQRKYDDVRHRFEVYGNASGLKHRWSDLDFDEVQQWVEAWLCREMYSVIFPRSAHGINSQDFLQDEQLQAKIAALNFLDLTLEHLGFVLDHPEDVEHIAQVVREGGVEMQKLASVKSPSDKMSVILSSHRVVVDALNREPAVQVLLEEKEVAGESVINTKRQSETFANNAAEPSSSSGAITDAAPAEERLSLQKVPMDEGYDRPSLPSMDGDKEEGSVAETTEERALESNVSESKDTVQEADSDEKKLTATDVSPADVALPLSPVPNEAAMPSITVPEISATPPVADAASGTTSGTAASPSSQSVSPKKQYSADVLLPLLIFSVVKSNPPMLISNLRYIQRFKVQDHLTGELAYCLTNMMAVVSFLETLDPQALGLSNDIRVVSDMSDIQATPGKPQPVPRINLQDGIDHTKALGHKVSQEIVGAAEEGIKVISDVVQDGYSKFFGRFLTTTDGTLPFGNSKAGVLNRSTRAMSAASSLAATAAASAAAEEERKRKASEEKNRGLVGLVSPAGVTSNVTVLSVDGTAGGAGVEKTSPHDSAMEAAARERVLEYMRNSEGPQLQFMACTDSGDLRLNDIKSLLDDYQRIGKMLEEIKRLA